MGILGSPVRAAADRVARTKKRAPHVMVNADRAVKRSVTAIAKENTRSVVVANANTQVAAESIRKRRLRGVLGILHLRATSLQRAENVRVT
jgi:hypothetical protein